MKDNKLLKEYLGLTVEDKSYLIRGERISVWHPHKDWNDLMLVVERIVKESKENLNPFLKGYFNRRFYSAMMRVDIEAVYNACVEYIKQKP